MSQDNVELVKASYAAWNAGDMDAIRAMLDPSIVLRAPEHWPEAGPFTGPDEVMAAFEGLRETFDSDWQELKGEPIGIGDRVVVRTVWHGVGRGPEMLQESTPVFTVRSGSIVHIEFFADHAEALEAVEAPPEQR
jgi:ketosteroid isomerase-like protein